MALTPMSKWLADNQDHWHAASKLLKDKQYRQISQLLRHVGLSPERVEDALFANLLHIARQICEACAQYEAETRWHLDAFERARRRERDLRQTLEAIFEVVYQWSHGGGEMILPPAEPKRRRERSISAETRNLWARMQKILGFSETAPPLSASPSPQLPDLPVIDMTAIPALPAAARPARMASVTVYTLGVFRVYVNEQLVEKWPGNKCKEIFKYLLVNRGKSIHHEILTELIWPDVGPESARKNLYQAIYNLRQALRTNGSGGDYILCEDSCYCFNPELELWVDSEAFLEQYQTGRKLEAAGHPAQAVAAFEAAESMYEGEFLAEDPYTDWLLVHRENLKHAYLDILERLSRHYFTQAQWAMCISFCQKILANDNCREDAHRRLMRCYVQQGQRNLALRQFHFCVEALRQELDVPPMADTLALYQQIRRGQSQDSVAS
ncbi:MAG: hypothetical protein D6768_01880 [Chloroflexi bacterium]|nr:MAG: hypothetical protein D6768_01880 [Chloroflexota bacterium]